MFLRIFCRIYILFSLSFLNKKDYCCFGFGEVQYILGFLNFWQKSGFRQKIFPRATGGGGGGGGGGAHFLK